MAKVRCSVCQYEKDSFCSIKKNRVSKNKTRICNKFVLEETKAKQKPQKTMPVRMGYAKTQALKAKLKAERKEFLKMLKEGPREGTAQDLGLIDKVSPGAGYEMSTGGIIIPTGTKDNKHPLTGDLSRFTTTAEKKED